MNTALILIATRQRYWEFAEGLIASAKKFFIPHDVVIFTDRGTRFDVCHQFTWHSHGYPGATLYRYHAVMSQQPLLSTYDNIFYADVDMLFVDDVGDILSEGITATQHPGYHVRGIGGTPETRPTSMAYCPYVQTYYCGGFNGGTSKAYLEMAEKIRNDVDTDMSKDIIAVWHDESHLNRYLFEHPPAKVLSPSYCYPEDYGGGYGWPATQYKPILLALEKKGQRG